MQKMLVLGMVTLMVTACESNCGGGSNGNYASAGIPPMMPDPASIPTAPAGVAYNGCPCHSAVQPAQPVVMPQPVQPVVVSPSVQPVVVPQPIQPVVVQQPVQPVVVPQPVQPVTMPQPTPQVQTTRPSSVKAAPTCSCVYPLSNIKRTCPEATPVAPIYISPSAACRFTPMPITSKMSPTEKLNRAG